MDPQSLWQCLSRLDSICRSSTALSSLLFTAIPQNITDSGEEDSVIAICKTMIAIIDLFPLQKSNDDSRVSHFLKSTFPVLVEAMLRRRTCREHEPIVSSLLVKSAGLLAQEGMYIQCVPELAELRNLLLLGGSSTLAVNQVPFKFIDAKMLKHPNTGKPLRSNGNDFPSLGFYHDFGRPNSVVFGSKLVSFWPDEWFKLLGGDKSVGHLLQFYSKSQSRWLIGKVVGYNRTTDKYSIQLDKSLVVNVYGDVEIDHSVTTTVSESTTTVDELSVHLEGRLHHWVDCVDRTKVGVTTTDNNSLTFSDRDVGMFIRIFWSRYGKFYYGRVIGYNGKDKNHSVKYEDADVRSYDMRMKEYEIVYPPPSLSFPPNASDDQLAIIVANWHRSNNNSSSKSRGGEEAVSVVDNSVEESVEHQHQQPQDVIRPPASQAPTVSMHQLSSIRQFFNSKGDVSMFHSLCDPNPPSCRILLLDLQLIYNLKSFIGSERFRDMTWDMKEGIPIALSRYSDVQIKDFTRKQLDDVCWGIKDMVATVTKDVPTNGIAESIDIMKMSMSLKLLSSSQLQKRYLGLSMIKDAICGLFNKLVSNVEKRYISLGVKKNSTNNGNQYPNANNNNNNSKSTLTPAYIDKWLISNDIIELIFGESLHQDLAAKSDIVLSYMALRGLITEKHIDILWTASKGHEAVTRVIYLLILLITPMISYPLRTYLFSSSISVVPMKDYNEQYLNLVKSFTLQFLMASKQENGKENNNNNANQSGGMATLEKSKSSDNDSVIKDGNTNNNRKGMVVNIAPRQWLGFGILWQYVQDSPKHAVSNQTNMIDIDRLDDNNSLIETAINLLVELLQEEFRDERDLVIARCLDNIQAGISVPVSLQILRKTLSLYPTHHRNWFGGLSRPPTNKILTVNNQIEKLVKNNRLLDILFNDLDKYHRSMEDTNKLLLPSRSTSDLLSLNDRRIQNNSKKTKLRGITERLDFLKFLISESNIKLDHNQTNLLWDALGEGIVNSETLEKFFTWLNSLVDRESKVLSILLRSLSQENDPSVPDKPSHLSMLFHYNSNDTGSSTNVEDFSIASDVVTTETSSSAFEEGVVATLYGNKIVSWASHADKIDILCNPEVAMVCFKLFLLLNITNKSIRVNEMDNSWCRTGRLAGISVIWHIGMNGANEQVANAAIALLIELHHRIPVKIKGLESLKGDFLKQCFKELYLSIQSLQVGDQPPPQSSHHSHIQKNINSNNNMENSEDTPQLFELINDDSNMPHPSIIARRVNRLIFTLRLFIQRFYRCPTQLISISVLAGRNDSPVVTMTMKATDTIGKLRTRMAKQFKEAVDSISISKIQGGGGGNKGQQFVLERDDVTLHMAKFQPYQLILVRKKDTSSPSVPNKNEKIKSNSTDLFKSEDILEDFINNLNLMEWLRSDSVPYELFCTPSHPWKSHIDFGTNLDPSPQHDQHLNFEKDNTFSIASVNDYLAPHIKSCPFYIDQLLEMLDGYLSSNAIDLNTNGGGGELDLSVAVWDILQSLPTHAILYKQIEEVVIEENFSKLSQLLDQTSSYRLLYCLQIVESFLRPTENINKKESRNISNFAIKLFHIGGVEYFVQLYQSTAKKFVTPSNYNDRQRKKEFMKNDSGMCRDDIVVVIVSILNRIIHELLILDPLYSNWVILLQNGRKRPDILSNSMVDKAHSDRIPAGVVISTIDYEKFLPMMLDTLYSGFCLHSVNQISGLALLSLSENILVLFLSLLSANEEAISILDSSTRFVDIVKLLCIHCENKLVREGTCRRLFDACANIYKKCVEPMFPQKEKKIRLQLFDYIYFSVIKAGTGTVEEEEEIVKLQSYPDANLTFVSFEQIFNVIAVIESLRSAPHLIFSELKQQKESSMNTNNINNIDSNFSDPKHKEIQSCIDIKFICHQFTKRLLSYKSQEVFHSLHSDGTLLGILKILLVISLGNANQKKLLGNVTLLQFLYCNCLFPDDQSVVVVDDEDINNNNTRLALCQTKESRSYAYNIIYSLCESDTDLFVRFVSVVNKNNNNDNNNMSTPNKQQQKQSQQGGMVRKKGIRWEYDPGELVKEPDAYVGLSNQGGTCYMNSFLQQLYHVQPFSTGILSIKPSSSNNKEYEDMLFQLQVMFGHLRLSQKRYYDTLPFCRSFYDYDGQPISLTEQKDINEFAGMLFEKLEHNDECKNLLSDTVQGKFVWKTKSTESSYTSEREENFYMITAEVKDKACLEDSLELNSAEELFSGDNKIEDDTGRKVEALRRCAIRHLPPTLIIHLKRFEFDLETMNRKKVNDFISFPMELDMFPYTEEAIKAKEQQQQSSSSESIPDPSEPSSSSAKTSGYYHYYLKGVVAHVGAIDRGHYYSFIHERTGNKWYEFNDRTVLPFSPEAIPSECFGGMTSSDGGGLGGGENQRMRENSAYLLFYERRREDITEQQQQKVLSEKVVETIWNENVEFQTDRFLFDKKHLKFLWHLQQSHALHDIMTNIHNNNNNNGCDSDHIADFCLFCLRFDLEVLVMAKATGLVHMFFERLEEIVLEDNTRKCAEKIVSELGCGEIGIGMATDEVVDNEGSSTRSSPQTSHVFHRWLVQMFVKCPNTNTTQAFSRLVWTCLKALRPLHCDHYLETHDIHSSTTLPHDNFKSCVSRLMSKLLVLLEKIPTEAVVANDGE